MFPFVSQVRVRSEQAFHVEILWVKWADRKWLVTHVRERSVFILPRSIVWWNEGCTRYQSWLRGSLVFLIARICNRLFGDKWVKPYKPLWEIQGPRSFAAIKTFGWNNGILALLYVGYHCLVRIEFDFDSSVCFCFREKKQKIEDIKKNIRDAILVSIHFCNILLLV